MMSIKYELISTHPKSLESTHSLLQSAKNNNEILVGIEVTTPDLQLAHDIVIDPQHSGEKRSDTSAIDYCLQHSEELAAQFKDKNLVLTTERADLDSIGAMAIIMMAVENKLANTPEDLKRRVALINRIDNAGFGEWHPKPVEEAVLTTPEVGAIGKAITDFQAPVAERVFMMQEWLEAGKQPERYAQKHENEVRNIRDAIKTGATKISVNADGIAIVESSLAAATAIGYSQSPVVIAVNEEFKTLSGDTQRKATICQYAGTAHLDIPNLQKALNALEPGWGGNANLLGSPMATGTNLSAEDISSLVAAHIKQPIYPDVPIGQGISNAVEQNQLNKFTRRK